MESHRCTAVTLLVAAAIGLSVSACAAGGEPKSTFVGATCSTYVTLRPLVAKVIEMDAKVRTGGRAAGTSDAGALLAAVDAAYPQVPGSHPEESARGRAFAAHAYKLALDIRLQANVVADNSYSLDLTIGELAVRQDAHNLDEYVSGSDGGTALCASMSIASPYPAALPPG
jgi:hypothetical protein